jgi:integrase
MLLDRWLEVVELDLTTRAGYVAKIEKHIRPTLGHLPLAKIDAELLEHFYARLRRCREQCSGRPARGHTCQPLAPSTVRQIHWILSGALGRAVRWRWIAVNPANQAEPPGLTPPNPELPSAKDAARILTAAWEKDPDWGSFLWLAMTTGARRGELRALQWQHVDLEVGVLTIATAVAQAGGTRAIKATKTHQKRQIALDAETVAPDYTAATRSRRPPPPTAPPGAAGRSPPRRPRARTPGPASHARPARLVAARPPGARLLPGRDEVLWPCTDFPHHHRQRAGPLDRRVRRRPGDRRRGAAGAARDRGLLAEPPAGGRDRRRRRVLRSRPPRRRTGNCPRVPRRRASPPAAAVAASPSRPRPAARVAEAR